MNSKDNNSSSEVEMKIKEGEEEEAVASEAVAAANGEAEANEMGKEPEIKEAAAEEEAKDNENDEDDANPSASRPSIEGASPGKIFVGGLPKDTTDGMDESSQDSQSPQQRPPDFRVPPPPGGYATPSTQASQAYGYGAINHMMMGMNMSPGGSSTPYFGGGYQPIMDPYYAGMVGGSPPAPGYSFPGIGSPRIIGPVTQYLQGGILPPFRGTSPFSGTPLSSHSEKHTTDDTSSSKKSRGRDEFDVSSLVRKSKRNTENKLSRAQGNKIWEAVHDDFVIPYLAELAKQGCKVDKTFKPSAFSIAARAVNKKFGTDFGGNNVSNHYRSLKTRFQDICSCFNISGAGWDEEARTITLDPISYDRWGKKNTKLKEYVNKPLRHFDDLRLIVGDDFATDEFKKRIFEKFGKIPFSTIHESNESQVDMHQGTVSAEDFVEQHIGGSGGSRAPIRIPNAIGMGGSKSNKGRKKKQVVDDDVMRTMVDKVGDLSNAIRETIPIHWTVQLSQCVYGHLDYDDVVLDTAYERLFESEMGARFFIAKPLNAQKRYLDKIVKELNQDMSTPRASVETVSSSDDDGDGRNDNEVDLTA